MHPNERYNKKYSPNRSCLTHHCNAAWTSSIVFKKQFYSALMHPSLHYCRYYLEVLMASVVVVHARVKVRMCVLLCTPLKKTEYPCVEVFV